MQGLFDDYASTRHRVFAFRHEADLATMIALSVGMAALTGLAAQVRVPIPYSPVPITMQTFAVLLAGIVLGRNWGAASQGIYAGLGIAGVPWFTGLSGGIGHLLGPTGGYVVGFVVAAAFVGWVTDRYTRARRLHYLLGVLAVANFAIVYGFGVPWLYVWSTVLSGGSMSVVAAVTGGALVFVPGDVAKLVAAALVGRAIAPQEPFGPETDDADVESSGRGRVADR